MLRRPSHYNSRYKHDLSPRQCEVLDLIAAGRTNAEIAEDLGVSLDGAKWHVREILGKLGLESREEAAEWWHNYQRPAARVGRTLSGLLGLGLWKTTAAVGGLAVVGVVAAGGAMAFRGGIGGTSAVDLPECAPGDQRWEATTELVGDSTWIVLSIGLRKRDWYEGVLHAVRVSDRNLASPCLISNEASVQLNTLQELPDAPPALRPIPLCRSPPLRT